MSASGRILIIEDDPAIVMTLRRLLTDEGHQVHVQTRGDTGLSCALRETFDLVLSDIKLPGLGGLDLVRQLHEAKPRLPIILMTAHGTTETAIQATQSGAFDYLVKPFEMPELLTLVEKAIASSRLMSDPVDFGGAGAPRGRHRGQQPRHAGYLQGSRPHRRTAGQRSHSRRDRHRQGADRPSDLSAQRPGEQRRSSPSIALPFRKRCWKANCSATNAARSRAPNSAASAVSNRPTTAPSSLTRSVT